MHSLVFAFHVFFKYPMLLSHLKIIQVSRQLGNILGGTITSVVLEVVGQTIIKEHGPLAR